MSFLNKLNFMFIFNSLVCPFIVALMLEKTTGKGVHEEEKLIKNQEEQ